MAVSKHERVDKAMNLLKEGLTRFAEREIASSYGKYWITRATEGQRNDVCWNEDEPNLDIQVVLKMMWSGWTADNLTPAPAAEPDHNDRLRSCIAYGREPGRPGLLDDVLL